MLIAAGTSAALGEGSSELTADSLLLVTVFYHGGAHEASIPDSAWIIKAKPEYSGVACPTSVTVRYSYSKFIGYDANGYPQYQEVTYYKTYPVTAMMQYAFNETQISSFQIPNNIKNCRELPNNNSYYLSTSFGVSNCTKLTSISIPDWATHIHFTGCSSLTDVPPLPIGSSWDFSYSGVMNIDFLPPGITSIWGFRGCNIPIVNIPETVKTIDCQIYSGAFMNCHISRLTIPESVESIDDYAFSDCGEIKELVWNAKHCINRGIGYLRGYEGHLEAIPFKGTSFESVTVGKNVEYLSYYLVSCPDENYAFTAPVKKLTWNAINCNHNMFYTEDLEHVIIGNEVQLIPVYFAYKSKITEVTIPNSVTTIDYGAFEGCTSLTNVKIPSSVTTIGSAAFGDCTGLTELHLNAKNISYPSYNYNYSAFQGCENLSHIIIGDNVESISENHYNVGVFYIEDDINHIQKVTCFATVPPVITEKCFTQKTYDNAVLEVPQGSLEAYRNAEGWKKFFKCTTIDIIPGEGDETLKGDVNNDGKVSIDDVTTLIDYLLGGNIYPFNAANADVNNDGKVSIDDVTALIDYLLSGTW